MPHDETPHDSSDDEQSIPAPATPAPDRFDQYPVRRDPATGTRLVNITTAPRPEWDEYIGRRNSSYQVAESEWANPYRLGDDGDREEVVEQYRAWLADHLRDTPGATDRLRALQGQTLACWCVGQTDGHTACHGDVVLDAIAALVTNDAAPGEQEGGDT